jgi:hypothetical protein
MTSMGAVLTEDSIDLLTESGDVILTEDSLVIVIPGIDRPRMKMVPFATVMYVDDILLYRGLKVVNDLGDTIREFPDEGIPSMAMVQSRRVDRMDKSGRVTTVVEHRIHTPDNIQAKPDDKIEWLDRTLTVEVGTIPQGTGDITFETLTVESK